MGRKMKEADVRDFMAAGSRTGKLATVKADGSPHVAPIWFDFDENGDVIFLTHSDSLKARNLRRDPRVSLLADDERMPFSWAKIDGTVTFSEDPGELLFWATETCRRYVGNDLADTFGRRNGIPGEFVVRLHPTSLRGEWGVAE
jgi:PPOX class probable F420-dependent enzyme